MPTQQKNIAIGLGIVVILLVLGALYYFTRPAASAPLSGSATSSIITTNLATSSSSNSIVTGAYTMTVIPESKRPAAPDITAPLAFDSSVSADVRPAMNTQLAALKALIKTDPLDFNAWVNVGTLRLIAGDYQGALKVWQYASTVWPSNGVSFANLGNLYANNLKNYPLAETNYLIAIRNKPSDVNSYENLFDLYSSVYKTGTPAAVDILKKGIAANPKAVNLQVLLARYYKSQGDSADAQTEYSAAASNAQAQGNSDQAAQIRAEASGQ